MKPFRIELTDEAISSNSGLAIVGQVLDSAEFCRTIKLLKHDDSAKDFKNIDIIKTYLGMLSLGKNNYEDVDNFKNCQSVDY